MKLLNWIDGSTNYKTIDKALHAEDDYKPRESFYDQASSAKKAKSIVKNSYLFYFN